MKPRLLLVEDHVLIAEALRNLLAPDYEVVGIVANGEQVEQAVTMYRPDLLLLDLTLPGRPGLEVLSDLASSSNRPQVLVVTMHVSRVLVEMALRLGASGFVPKNVTADEFRTAISEVLAGRQYVSPKVPKRGHRGTSADPLGFCRLTASQQEIVRLIGSGLTTDEIAVRLGKSPHTVSFHRKNIRRELGLHSDQEMYRYALLVALSETSEGSQSPPEESGGM